ncbi:amidohydrolase family protein [Aureimonas mangrovi]|uniref:amidohydrolase family protein n=1 Tax=Aureimonas mangrovi TaxID=2758041 RepID=UPI00163D433B
MFDRILRGAKLDGREDIVDIGIASGRIAAIEPALPPGPPEDDAGGRFVCQGFTDAHIHLDKACILERCQICDGTLAEAVALTAAAKAKFTVEDVFERASSVVERAIGHGTMRMRSFVETDPRAGLRSFEALLAVKARYAHALDIDLCAFAQEGLTQEMETHALLESALRGGATSVGGCPYQDPDPARHIALVLDLAERFGVPADFHIDFDLDPESSDLPALIAAVEVRGLGGRVSVGHATKISAIAPDAVEAIARRLREAGIAVVVLPATDLFLNGRGSDRLVPRGVAPADRLAEAGILTAIATNNVLNPFTPYGDASLLRMANLFANVAQLSTPDALSRAFSMIEADAARLIGHEARIEVGAPADLLVLDAASGADAVRRIAQPMLGFKAGRRTFEHALPRLFEGETQ